MGSANATTAKQPSGSGGGGCPSCRPAAAEPEPGVLAAEDLRRLGHLIAADLGHPAVYFGQVHRGIEDVAALATGQRHHQYAGAFGGVAGQGGGALAGLVVRVCMHRHQPKFAHLSSTCAAMCRLSSPIVPVPILLSDRRAPKTLMIERPADRYGRPRLSRPARRWTVIGLAVLILTAGVAIAVVGFQRLGSGDVQGTLGGYQLVDDETVSVTISVTRADPSRPGGGVGRARAMG